MLHLLDIVQQDTFRSLQPFSLGIALSRTLLQAFAFSKSLIHYPISGFTPWPPCGRILDLPCSANITLTPVLLAWRTASSLLVYAGRLSRPVGQLCSHEEAQKEPSSQSPSDQLPDLRSPVLTTPNTKFLSVVFWPSCLARYAALVATQQYIATLLQTRTPRFLHGVVGISHGPG